MKLIVGLGNRGDAYEDTRHNVGCRVLKKLADRHAVRWRPGTVWSLCGDWQVGEETVLLVRPITMMNRSGAAVARDAQDVKPQDCLIVCDDVNLPLGTLRMRAQGGAGGHHGLASCLESFGTEDVPRLRVGVGSASLPKDLTEFVLSPFRNEERPVVEDMVARAVEACALWVQEGIATAMNQVNG